MKILDYVADYAVSEANFEGLRLALNYIDDAYSPAYFHGIAGTSFRVGGICPCAPTCTTAMSLQQLITLLGYDFLELPFTDGGEDEIKRMTDAVRASIDAGVPALVWNAFTPCEWKVVTGYSEEERVFFGRAPWQGRCGEYAKAPWDKAKEEAGLVGLLAIILKKRPETFVFSSRDAELSALREAVRHGNDSENADKAGGPDWVFLQGKAAMKRWSDDFAKPDKERGPGDAYCIDIYSSCHGTAGEFLRGIAPNYPSVKEELLKSSEIFDKEAELLRQLVPLLTWSSPWGVDAQRNAQASPLLRGAYECYAAAVDALESALARI
ncbi:MAG: hypothetical protein AB9835_09615 [Eubacteriales bacterium]